MYELSIHGPQKGSLTFVFLGFVHAAVSEYLLLIPIIHSYHDSMANEHFYIHVHVFCNSFEYLRS